MWCEGGTFGKSLETTESFLAAGLTADLLTKVLTPIFSVLSRKIKQRNETKEDIAEHRGWDATSDRFKVKHIFTAGLFVVGVYSCFQIFLIQKYSSY